MSGQKKMLQRKLTGVSHKVAVDARLELVGVFGLNVTGSARERVEVNIAHAVQVTAIAANSR